MSYNLSIKNIRVRLGLTQESGKNRTRDKVTRDKVTRDKVTRDIRTDTAQSVDLRPSPPSWLRRVTDRQARGNSGMSLSSLLNGSSCVNTEPTQGSPSNDSCPLDFHRDEPILGPLDTPRGKTRRLTVEARKSPSLVTARPSPQRSFNIANRSTDIMSAKTMGAALTGTFWDDSKSLTAVPDIIPPNILNGILNSDEMIVNEFDPCSEK